MTSNHALQCDVSAFGGAAPELGRWAMQKSPDLVHGMPAHAEATVRWLKRELIAEQPSGGFYHNRSIIRSAARDGELRCLVSGRYNLGFAVFTVGLARFAIDILAIQAKYHQRGYGRLLAESVISTLFERGAPEIEVQCSPFDSEHFWRRLGFSGSCSEREPMSIPRLILRTSA